MPCSYMSKILSSLVLVAVLLVCGGASFAQTTSFTYQGRLTDSGTPANATYDMQFKLFDAGTNGNQIGSPITNPTVQVTNGVFTVQLNFGDGTTAFPGADRFIEVSIRPMGSSGPYTVLAPRQKITSTAYAIRSLTATSADTATTATTATNATQLGGQPASQYVLTSDSRLSDARTPAAGSSNYIQNGTNPQTGASFNVGGNGTAGGTLTGNVMNSATNYQIGGNRALGVTGNTVANSTTFVGSMTGASGDYNSLFGVTAGNHTTGGNNSFFGAQTGLNNTTGNNNAFFGAGAGTSNKEGVSNSFFGYAAGFSNTTLNSPGVSGNSNSFFGYTAGYSNTTGNHNTIVGDFAGLSNTTENNNTFVGGSSNGAAGVHDSTAIGYGATVTASNTIALGRSSETVQVPGNLSVTGALNGNGSSLTNLNANNIASGTLAIAQGGTGLSSSGAGGNYLRSNGTGWTSSALQPADIPDLSSTYIKNTTQPQNTSNFNIDGNGTAGGTLSANIFNATTQYNIGGSSVLSVSGVGFDTNSNLFAGIGAGSSNTPMTNGFGNNNSFYGFNAGNKNTTGFHNSFVGTEAGSNNMMGDNNSFFGNSAGTTNTTGVENSFFGSLAGRLNQTGRDNSFFGVEAGSKSTGNNNTMIGSLAGSNLGTGDNNIYLANQGVSSESNTIRIGQSLQNVTYIAGISGTNVTGANVLVTSTGQLGVLGSSRRFKENIHQMGKASEGLMRLRPVTFFYKPEYSQGPRALQYGLIAEEVAKIYPDLVQRSADGKPFTVLYHLLTPMLLNEVQKQQQQIKTQAEEIASLAKRLARVEARSARRSHRRR